MAKSNARHELAGIIDAENGGGNAIDQRQNDPKNEPAATKTTVFPESTPPPEANLPPKVADDEETGEIPEPKVEQATQTQAAEKPAEPAKAKTAPAAKADAAKAEDAPNPKLKVIFDQMAAAKTIEALDEIYIRAEGELDGAELEMLMREYRKFKNQVGLF